MANGLYQKTADAAHSKMKKLYEKAADGTKKKLKKLYQIVPGAYKELEYIESSGTQYINTGFTPNQNSRVVIDVDLVAASSGNKGIFGCRTSGSSDGFCVWQIGANNLYSYYGTTSVAVPVASSGGRFLIDKDGAVTTVNGTVYSLSKQTFTCPGPIYLFTVQTAGNTLATSSAGRLYACQIYDNGVLVRDFVPCASPDGKVGLYDKVSREFCENAGDGTFAAGTETGLILLTKKTATLVFEGGPEFTSYSGVHTISEVEVNGAPHTLYTITGSGTLALSVDAENAKVWMCGGGGGGGGQSSNGGGGGGYFGSYIIKSGNYYVITIGAGGSGGVASNTSGNKTGGTGNITSISSIGSVNGGSGASSYAGGQGGSGGGAAGSAAETGGMGDGKTTYPFEMTSLKAHCAGGGGGSYEQYPSAYYIGGAGGGNGSDGGARQKTSYPQDTTRPRSTGGTYGGGQGGSSSYAGLSGSFYGAGGGGGGRYTDGTGANRFQAGGSGYQGVVYVLIPA